MTLKCTIWCCTGFAILLVIIQQLPDCLKNYHRIYMVHTLQQHRLIYMLQDVAKVQKYYREWNIYCLKHAVENILRTEHQAFLWISVADNFGDWSSFHRVDVLPVNQSTVLTGWRKIHGDHSPGKVRGIAQWSGKMEKSGEPKSVFADPQNTLNNEFYLFAMVIVQL